jgi:hypothetical protein
MSALFKLLHLTVVKLLYDCVLGVELYKIGSHDLEDFALSERTVYRVL